MYARDTAWIATPIGMIVIEGDDDAIVSIRIVVGGADEREAETAVVRAAVDQLRAYFDGSRKEFELPLQPALTPRGQVLRDGMTDIPYGETMTYGELARQLDSAPRAIGQACARNPYPIVVPCHRVLGGGGLGYYSARDGPSTKRWLLDRERRHSGASLL